MVGLGVGGDSEVTVLVLINLGESLRTSSPSFQSVIQESRAAQEPGPVTLLRFLPSPPAKVFSVQPKIPGRKPPRLLQLRLQFFATWNTGSRDPSFPFPDLRKLSCLVGLSILHFPSLYSLYRPFRTLTLFPRLFWGCLSASFAPTPSLTFSSPRCPRLLLQAPPSAQGPRPWWPLPQPWYSQRPP